jgi:hypothetical protein
MKLFPRLGCIGILAVALIGSACTGSVGQSGGGGPAGGGGPVPGAGNSGTTPNGGNSGTGALGGGGAGTTGGTGAGPGGNGSVGANGGFTAPASTYAALRKIKNVLTGLAPTDAEITAATGATALPGLQGLIDTWMATPQFQDKMILFFQNAYQQSSLAQLDFEFQLRKRPGAFDLPYNIFGDTAFPMLFKNMKESFARTALQLIAEGRPFTDILTTQRFMMTTALKSLYLQIEMPYDIGSAPVHLDWQFNQDYGSPRPADMSTEIANLTFNYAAPTTTTVDRNFGNQSANCAGKVSAVGGSTLLFQVLLGVIARDAPCMEHAIKPYFTPQDVSDWQMVTIVNTGTPLRSYDLPAIRASGATLSLRLPRVSFFTTPAFLAVWNTNDSNQHRVTANQALLAALGQGFTNATASIPAPPSSIGLDGVHAVAGTTCFVCHKSLDPMRQFWANSYDFNDQVGRVTSMAASFGFGDVQKNGTSLVDFGTFVGQVTDSQVPAQPVNRFALATTQHLCFFANSAACEETDPEMRRVALAFQNGGYNFKTLVRELFSSPLVTSWASTATFLADGVTISVARRDQLCTALSNRLGKADLCEITMPTPTGVTTAVNRLAGSIPADAFSRGSQLPVTPPDPNLFYRAASELVCEAVATKVVDGPAATSVYASATGATTAMPDMVVKIMGLPAADPHYAGALKALQDHYAAAIAARATTTTALRSTFAAACQSPPSLSLGI